MIDHGKSKYHLTGICLSLTSLVGKEVTHIDHKREVQVVFWTHLSELFTHGYDIHEEFCWGAGRGMELGQEWT